MVIDLGQTGGQRPSRSSRSDGARLAPQQQRVKRTDTARMVATPNGFAQADALSAVSTSLSSFFPALDQFDATNHEEEMQAIKVENSEEIARIESQVRADPDGAREAQRTGDYSKFIPDDEMRSRRVIGNVFKSIVATQMANTDFDTGLKKALDDADDTVSYEDVVAGFIDTQTKDADAIFAQQYGRTIAQASGRYVANLKQGRLEAQQKKAEATASVMVKESLAKGQIPPTSAGLDALQKQFIGALPMNHVDKVKRGMAGVDTALIKLAASGEPGAAAALKMMLMPDSKRDGQSIAQLHPGVYEKAVASYHATQESFKSQAAIKMFEGIEDRMSRLQRGVGDPGDSLGKLWADTLNYKKLYGEDTGYERLRDAFPRAAKTAATLDTALDAVVDGKIINAPSAVYNKLADKFFTTEMTEALVKKGLTKEQALTVQVEAVAKNHSSPTMRQIHSKKIMSSTDAEEVTASYQRLKTIYASSSAKSAATHLEDDAQRLFRAMAWAEERGEDPMAFRATWLENQAGVSDSDKTHFYRRLGQTDEDSKASKRAADGFLEKAWKDLDRPDLEFESGLFSDDKQDYDTLPQIVKDRMHTAINQASMMLANKSNVTNADIANLAMQYVKDSLSVSRTSNGKFSTTIDRTPTFAAAGYGQMKAGAPASKGLFERADKAMLLPANKTIAARLGTKTPGLTQDDLTETGEGMGVTMDRSGVEVPVTIIPGEKMLLPASEVEGTMGKFFKVTAADKGRVVIEAPAPPEPGAERRVYASENFFFTWDDRVGLWNLRYGDINEGEYKSLKDLSSANKAKREDGTEFDRARAMQQGNRSSVRKGLREALKARDAKAAIGAPVWDAKDPVLTPTQREKGLENRREVVEELVRRGLLAPADALGVYGDSDEWED